MKKFINAVVLFVFVLSASFALAGEEIRDPRMIAASFAKLGRENHYSGLYEYSVVVSDGVTKTVSGRFTVEVRADGSLGIIISFSVDGEDVPLAKPLTRFPYDTRGKMVRVWIAVTGYADAYQAKPLSWGALYYEVLEQNQPLQITLKPSYVYTIAKVSLPDGVNPDNVRLVTADGNRYWYNRYSGGFQLWLDPVLGNQEYTIVDGTTGAVIASGGTVGAFLANKTTPDNSLVLTREEGVQLVTVNKTNTWQNFDNQSLVTKITYKDTVFPAKVFYADNLGGGNLRLYLYGVLKDYTAVMFQEVLDDGSLKLIKTVAAPGPYMDVETQGSYDKIVVTVFGTLANPDGTFNVQFGRQREYSDR